MTAEKMNEYLLELNVPPQPQQFVVLNDESKSDALLRDQERRDLYASTMMIKTTDWVIKSGLTDSFQRASVATMPQPGRAWLVIECTEALQQKLCAVFPRNIKKSVKLGRAASAQPGNTL
ncbi:MAG: hypothetical protein HND56_05785 [Pseudomonadota bacterium]|jgi:hypothetical protein|nr:hypothetical protein [Pseudomonadota bacterium]QKK05226.1 MAG: hypothetical protein HND56_05785 [Pseudomonadota bacterium]|tara:strand:- start:205 stop:564 length:360 start_codon:yes stop_codon:yes gene_type:complete